MKTKIYAQILKTNKRMVILFAAVLFSAFSIGQTPTLTLLSPNGGETWLQGSTCTITWQLEGDFADLIIEYTEDGNYWYYLSYVDATDSTSTYSFQNYLWETDMAKIRISIYDNDSVADESDDYFSIIEPPVYIYSPYNGDTYYRTAPVYISWSSQSILEFTLDYSLDNGATWTNIIESYSGNNYTWYAPDQLSDEAVIRISDAIDTTAYGLSPVFSIIEIPTISLIAPNGGETWTYGGYEIVSWTGTNLPYYVYLEFSSDGGQNWSYLGYGYGDPNGGSTNVYVPFNATENARIKVMDPNFAEVVDESDTSFTIVVPPVIVYQPYEEQQIYNKSQSYISWLAYEMDSLNIELSTDNGQTWQAIDQNIDANYGYYSWTLMAEATETAILKLTDAADPARFGYSNIFTILEAPVISITAPSGGDIWNTNTPYTISWTYDNPSAYYLYLEYSADTGQTWNFINYVNHVDVQGSYEWTTPDINSAAYLIRIKDYNLYFVSDTSDLFSILTFPETPICMVSVDSTTNHNVIVWDKPVSDLIQQFVVYKESDEANIYEALAYVDYNDLALVTDTNSNPAMKSYRYKLGFADAFGHLFPSGDYHQTIHLTINQGVGNSWNLIWTNYTGFEVASYNIYRKAGSGSYNQIATISASFNSYTDQGAPEGDVYYIVEVINPNGCNPASRADEFSVSRSNIASNSFLGVNDKAGGSLLSIYPNPVKDKLFIQAGESLEGKVNIMLSDLLGNQVYSAEMEDLQRNSTASINTSELKNGIYMLRISSESASTTRKVVVKR